MAPPQRPDFHPQGQGKYNTNCMLNYSLSYAKIECPADPAFEGLSYISVRQKIGWVFGGLTFV